LLLIILLVSGIFNIITNTMGKGCLHRDQIDDLSDEELLK